MSLSYKVDSTTVYTHIVTVKVLTLHHNADVPETTLTPTPLWWMLARPPLQICPGMSLHRELFGKPDVIKVGVYLGCDAEHAYFHLSGSAFLQVPRQWACPPQTFLDKLLSSFILRSCDGYDDLRLALVGISKRARVAARTSDFYDKLVVFTDVVPQLCIQFLLGGEGHCKHGSINFNLAVVYVIEAIICNGITSPP
ncbi:hypothetical protein BV25DRAFT_1840518 [Artomyces pyxidatus]|uniref:Uncharacterized protein n=1 Tax=Artomyces pyxidatus TaxID=48021 RepID=A0ACB8ST01_9AGAM|nr:hypothetical protein BV25DRAFT_1840518 [Artomyces pyxidatus]